MATRKTTKNTELLNLMNRRIRLCPDLEGRKALCSATEAILMDAKAYAGFMYVTADDLAVPAAVVQAEGWRDDYRHHYYTHNRLCR